MKDNSLWGMGGLLVGASASLILCWFMWVRPLQAHLDAREQSLHEWERINRMERENVAVMKTLSTEEARKWVATIDEQNQRFAQLQSRLHQQEIELTGPATSYIMVAFLAVFGVLGLVMYFMRDGNARAATTLENVAALAPEDMIRSVLVATLSQRETPVTISAEVGPTPGRLQAAVPPALTQERLNTGTVCWFDQKKQFGFIRLDGGGEDLWFHLNDVIGSNGTRLTEGVRVTFRRGVGKKGPKAVSVRVVEG